MGNELLFQIGAKFDPRNRVTKTRRGGLYLQSQLGGGGDKLIPVGFWQPAWPTWQVPGQ